MILTREQIASGTRRSTSTCLPYEALVFDGLDSLVEPLPAVGPAEAEVGGAPARIAPVRD